MINLETSSRTQMGQADSTTNPSWFDLTTQMGQVSWETPTSWVDPTIQTGLTYPTTHIDKSCLMKLHGGIWWLIESSLQQNGWSTEVWRCSGSGSGLVKVPKRLGQLRQKGYRRHLGECYSNLDSKKCKSWSDLNMYLH